MVGGLCSCKSMHITASVCTCFKHLGVTEGSSENFSYILMFCKCLALWFICPVAAVASECMAPFLWLKYMLLISQYPSLILIRFTLGELRSVSPLVFVLFPVLLFAFYFSVFCLLV